MRPRKCSGFLVFWQARWKTELESTERERESTYFHRDANLLFQKYFHNICILVHLYSSTWSSTSCNLVDWMSYFKNRVNYFHLCAVIHDPMSVWLEIKTYSGSISKIKTNYLFFNPWLSFHQISLAKQHTIKKTENIGDILIDNNEATDTAYFNLLLLESTEIHIQVTIGEQRGEK